VLNPFGIIPTIPRATWELLESDAASTNKKGYNIKTHTNTMKVTLNTSKTTLARDFFITASYHKLVSENFFASAFVPLIKSKPTTELNNPTAAAKLYCASTRPRL
jgi:hypothetical protein